MPRRRIPKSAFPVNNDTIVMCDCCGNSCMDKHGYNNEYIAMYANFGYGSNGKDTERWSANVCELCMDKHLCHLIKFKTTPTNPVQERRNKINGILK